LPLFLMYCRFLKIMKNLFIVTLLAFATNLAYAQKNITLEADGNLESPKPLLCVDLSEVTNEHNPADILHGMRKCIELKDYKNAASLFAIAGVYGRYDTYRVKDKSAHQALLVLQQNVTLDLNEEDKKYLMEHIKELMEPSSLNAICQAIRKIGPPNYHPRYMIQHSITAFLENEDNGLNEIFDSEESWKLTLKNYLRCGE